MRLVVLAAGLAAGNAALCTSEQGVRLLTDAYLVNLSTIPADYASTAAYLTALENGISAIDSPCVSCAFAYISDVNSAEKTAASGCPADAASAKCLASMAEIADAFSDCAYGVSSSAAVMSATAAILAVLAL